MNINSDGAQAASPTATSSAASSEAEVGSRAGSDFVGEAMRFLDGQAVSEPDADSADAQSADDASENSDSDAQSESTPESHQEKDKENALSPGVKRRIDSLTAKYRKEMDMRKQTSLENARLKEAVRLYTAELERVAQFAKLDPQQEKIRELELQREIDQIEGKLPKEIEAKFAEAAREAEVSDRAAEIADAIRGATSSWDGLFTARELALYMQQNRVIDASTAATALGNARLAAAQARTGARAPAAPAPTTAGVRGGSQRDSAGAWQYRGQSSILDFFEQEDAMRGKKTR